MCVKIGIDQDGGQISEGSSQIRGSQRKDLGGHGGESADTQFRVQENRRDGGAVQKVLHVVVDLGQLVDAGLQFIVDRRGFFVQGLQFFLGGFHLLVGALQFFVAALQFLVGALQFLVGGLELLVGGFKLLDGGMEIFPGAAEFKLQFLD